MYTSLKKILGQVKTGALMGLATFAGTLSVSAAPVQWTTNGHYYEQMTFTGNWEAAKANAATLSYAGVTGHLVTVTSQSENDFLKSQGWANAWIGGYQPTGSAEPAGGWTWVTGEAWSYAPWANGEPNNGNGSGENYVLFLADGSWGDRSGSMTKYIVEYDVIPKISINTENTNLNTATGSISYSYDTGHWYEFVHSSTTNNWSEASGAAAARKLYGQNGCLVGVSSAAEEIFIRQMFFRDFGLYGNLSCIGGSVYWNSYGYYWTCYNGESSSYLSSMLSTQNNVDIRAYLSSKGITSNSKNISSNNYIVEYNAGLPLTRRYAEGLVAQVTVYRDSGIGISSVDYATVDGTAVAGYDYTATSGTLTFGEGETVKTIDIPILSDSYDEGAETFTLTFFDPVNAAFVPAVATITIVDDPIVLSDATYSVNENAGTATITVIRSLSRDYPVTVAYATADGTAAAASDYTATSGSLTFYPGETVKTFTIPITADSLTEGNETFKVILSAPTSGATLGTPRSATITIVDNTTQFSTTDVKVAESAGSIVLTVLRPCGGAATTVNYATTPESATAGTNYTTTSGTLSFAADEISKTITIPILNVNSVVSKTFKVTLTLPVGSTAVLGVDSEATVTIVAAGAPGIMEFESGTYSVDEAAGTATLTVVRRDGCQADVRVSYATSDGTATAGSDYAAITGNLTFALGELKKTFTVPITNDNVSEKPETVKATLSNPSAGSVGSTRGNTLLYIIDNDDAGTIEFRNEVTSVREEAGTASITVVRPDGVVGGITVEFSTSDGTAVAGRDYTATTNTVTFAANEKEKTITIPVINNANVDGTRILSVTLNAPTGGAKLGSKSTTELAILEDDGYGTLQFSLSGYSAVENSGNAYIEVGRTKGTSGTVSIAYATTNGKASAGRDYTASSGILTFNPGQTKGLIVIPLLDNTRSDGAREFTVTLSAPGGGAVLGKQSSAMVTITDDDAAGTLQFSTNAFYTTEGAGLATVTVTRSGGVGSGVTVKYATSNGTAVATRDYETTTGTLTFGAGEMTKTFMIPIIDNFNPPADPNNPDMTIQLALSEPGGGGSLGAQKTAVLYVQNDDLPGYVGFDSDTAAISEGAGSVTVTITRRDGTVAGVSVDYSTSDDSAISGIDYGAVQGTLIFAGGETTKTITIPIYNNAVKSPDVAFYITLSNVGGGGELDLFYQQMMTIEDDEKPGTLQFKAAAWKVAENSGMAVITVARSKGSLGAVGVNFATANGTAVAGTDYTAVTRTLSFASGEVEKLVEIPIIDNVAPGTDKTVSLTLTTPTGGALLGTQKTATLTIADNDQPVTLASFVPATSALTTQAPASFAAANTVLAGDAITFAVNLTAAANTELKGSNFLLHPAEWNATTGRWQRKSGGQALTYRADAPAFLNGTQLTEAVAFAEMPTWSNFSWTQILNAGSLAALGTETNGIRTFTWTVPADLVTKNTPVASTIFLASIRTAQENGADGLAEWAVRVAAANRAPVISSPASDVAVPALAEGAVVSETVTAADPDTADSLGYAWAYTKNGGINWIQIDGQTTATLNWTIPYDVVTAPTPSLPGSQFQIRASVKDSDAKVPLTATRFWVVNTINDTPPQLLLETATWNAPKEAATKPVAITCNMSWIANSSQSWLTLAPASGSGNGSIALTVAANPTVLARTATVQIIVGNAAAGTIVQTIEVTQAAGDSTLSVSPASWTPTKAGGNQTVTVTSNTGWTAASNQSWLNLLTTDGTGNGSVTLTAAANLTFVERTATVTFSAAGGVDKTVTVTQAIGDPTLSIAPTSWAPTKAGGSQVVNVTSNRSWTVASNQTWLTLSATTGSGNGSVTLTATANSTIVSRTATVTFTAGALVQTVSITQAAGDPILSVSPASWTPTKAGGTQGAAIISNTSWTASSNQTWLTLSASTGTGDGSVTLTATANSTVAVRSATVTFSATGVTNQTITVTQAAGDSTLSVSPTSWAPTKAGGIQMVTVTSNTGWSIASNQTWLTLDKASGTSNGSVTLTAAANLTIAQRTAIVTFSATGVADQTVTVTQAAGDPTLSVLPASWTPTKAGGTQAVTVTGNADWTVASNQTWLTLSTTTGSANGSVTLTATANPTIVSRTATVTFSATGVTNQTVTVTQAAGDPVLSVSPATCPVTKTGGTQGIAITSNASWTVASNQGWLTLDKSSGTGDGSVTLTATANSTIAQRIAIVTFKATGIADQTVTVTQAAGDPVFSISLTNWAPAKTGGTQAVTVTANIAWTATSNQTWLTLDNASGTGDASVTLTASANPTIAERSATVTFSGIGVADQTITVTQPAGDPALSVSPASWAPAKGGGTQLVTVNCNIAWTVISDQSWLTLDKASGTNAGSVTLTAAANPTTSSRSATVTFSATNVASQTVIVTQAANPAISVNPTTWSAAKTSGTQSVAVTSNTDWTAVSNQTWLTLDKASGTGDGSVILTVTANPTIASRSATVTVSVAGADATVTVTQAAADPALVISPMSWTAPKTGGTQAVAVTSTLSWTVESNQTWLTLSAASGVSNGSVTLTAAANPTISSRQATVTFKAAGLTDQVVTVTQSANPTVSPSLATWSPTKVGGTQDVTVASNTAWTVVSNQTWLTLSAANGTGNGGITLTATANQGIAERTATVTFSASGATNQTIVVTQAAGDLPVATHASSGYLANGTCTVTCRIEYTGKPSALGWHVVLPAGWSYASGTNEPGTKPEVGDTDTLDWAWTTIPASPIEISYTMNVPAGETGSRQIAANLVYRESGVLAQPAATPSPLTIQPFTYHSADTDRNWLLSLLELTRVVELYNYRNGTTRTGDYHAQTGTEDGFAAGTGALGMLHSADTDRNSKLSLLELTRVIELYNYRNGTTRTGNYHVQVGTEDGFASGPAATPAPMPAKMLANPAPITVTASQSTTVSLYSAAGEDITVICRLTYPGGSPSALGWAAVIPDGWTYVSGTNEPGTKPLAGDTGKLEWAWTSLPATPLEFSYTVRVPAGQTGDKQISANAVYRESGTLQQPEANTIDLQPKASQTIFFDSLADKVFGNDPFCLEATTSSTLPVAYNSSNLAVATINGNTVTIVGAGSTVITASQVGNADYNAAKDVLQTLTVSAATLAISPTTWPAAKSGGTREVSVTSNTAWTVSSNQTWLTLSAAGGTGNGFITLTATVNPTVSERIATVTFGATGVTSKTVTVTQAAGDPILSIAPATWSVAKEGGSQSVTVTSNALWTISSDQTWLTASKAAGSGNDSVSLTAAANITASERTAVATFAVGALTKTVTVTQAPQVGLQFSPSTYSVQENGATATLTVIRSEGNAGAVTVQYTTANGTAIAGTDYTTKTGMLTFAAGVTSQTIAIAILNKDTVFKGDRNFSVTLSSPTGGAVLGTPVTATVTVQDDDISALKFGATSYTVAENVTGGKVTVTISRAANTGPVSVKYSTVDGTAKAGTDYTATSGTVSFTTETSKTFTVPVLNTSLVDGTRSFSVVLSDPSGGATLGTPATATVNITNDDKGGSIQLSATTAKALEDSGSVALTVTRSSGTASGVTVNYATADKTAMAGSDYTATSGTLTFGAGETSKTITVPVTPDRVVEPNETFTMTLSAPAGGATLGTNKVSTVTITNDDAAGTLQVASTTATVAENAGKAIVTVNRTGGASGTVGISYATANSTALAGIDYTTTSGTLVFAEGETSKTIEVPVIDNAVLNTNKTFKVMLSAPTGGVILGTNKTTTVTIANDDVGGAIQFSPTTYTVKETDGTVSLTIVRTATGPLAGGVTVKVATVAETTTGKAKSGVDYTPFSTILTFAAGETNKTITIPILDDTIVEPNETFKVTLSTPTGGATVPTAAASAIVTILNDDVGGTIQFSDAAYSVNEMAGTATITVLRFGGDASGVTVKYATATGGTASSSYDYKSTSGTLTFAAGEHLKTFTVPIISDTKIDPGETVKLVLSSVAGGGSLGTPATAFLTINEGTPAPPWEIVDFNQSDYCDTGTDADIIGVPITVVRASGTGTLSVNYATEVDSAIPGSDYTKVSGTLTFEEGETSKTFLVPVMKNPARKTPATVTLVLEEPEDNNEISAATLWLFP